MKLSGAAAADFFAKPDDSRTGILIYGADAMRVAVARQKLLAALLGSGAEEEMRLTRIAGADLRKDATLLTDAVKAVGFFPGIRAVFVEDATDANAPMVAAALEDWRPDDARIVVTAGQLRANAKLRKLFEAHANAYAVGLYDEPPGRAEIERMLSAAGLRDIPGDSLAAISDYAGDLGPGDFAQMLEKIALYKLGDTSPVSLEDIAACAPQSTEAGLDEMLNIVAEARSAEIGPVLRRLQSQGTNAVSLCIGATRHFRMLYAAASAPGGAAAGVSALRPPVYGKRRDQILRQAQNWGPARLETALTLLTDTDLQLRSAGQTAPAMAVVERALVRLAMLGRAR